MKKALAMCVLMGLPSGSFAEADCNYADHCKVDRNLMARVEGVSIRGKTASVSLQFTNVGSKEVSFDLWERYVFAGATSASGETISMKPSDTAYSKIKAGESVSYGVRFVFDGDVGEEFDFFFQPKEPLVNFTFLGVKDE